MRRQYITHSKFQTAFTSSFLIGITVMFAMIAGSGYISLRLMALEECFDASQQALLLTSAHSFFIFSVFMYLFTLLFFMWFGVYLSYKFVGPLTRLENWLEGQASGKAYAPLTLRPGDELEKIAFKLNAYFKKRSEMQ